MVESGPAVIKKATSKASTTVKASHFCARPGDKLERMKCCSSGTKVSVFTIGAPLRSRLLSYTFTRPAGTQKAFVPLRAHWLAPPGWTENGRNPSSEFQQGRARSEQALREASNPPEAKTIRRQ